ncbi:GP46-like surface antigen, putative [Bodo saltans]|uniref:GP46-like surface antigen, putative n=1 Tax=Bodo saltans TaxID=75058 RepID=A0A0S4J8R3_BODSA|nr:GP46-like surface antigen, putative [Bodo saltans]|eukprot:CUG70924.1 GP46-like surface antigen, putative [Bodo saltans]
MFLCAPFTRVGVVLLLLWILLVAVRDAHGIVSQDEADILAEFFVAVRYGNTTPVTRENVCTAWPDPLVTCNSGATIASLNFTSQNLRGTLPESLARLSSVTLIDVTHNNISGTLPHQYAAWGASLEYFSVRNNSITGSLPKEYSNLTSVREFYVSTNSLTGSIPPEYSLWKKISGFYVYNNQLTGTLPPLLANCTMMRGFQASNNSFSGTLPLEYASWTAIFGFDVTGNHLTGTLPHQYSSWLLMEKFQVLGNRLTGELPPQYASWAKLTGFYAALNQLHGTLPPSYSRWSKLQAISLANNRLVGPIPSSWGSGMTSLSTLFLSNNSLSGTIPSTPFPQLSMFSISFNNFSGLLPPSSTWPFLLAFDVQNNTQLVGPLVVGQVTLIAMVCGTSLCVSSSSSPAKSCLPTAYFATTTVIDINSLITLATSYLYPLALCSITTQAPSLEPSRQSNATTPQLFSSLSGVMSAAAATVYVTLATTGGTLGRGAVPGLQRAVASLRLTAATNLSSDDDDDASGSSLFGDLADNPLGISIPVGAVGLSASAGAALMDIVLVGVIGVVLHAIAMLQRWVRIHQSVDRSDSAMIRLVRAIVLALPASLLPGALAMPYGTLLSSGVGACLALVVSTARSSGSVALGVTLVCVWAALPLYCAWAVVVRTRRTYGEFALHSVPTRSSSGRRSHGRTRSTKDATSKCVDVLLQVIRYAVDPTGRWERRSTDANVAQRRRRRGGRISATNNMSPSSYHKQAEYLLENMEGVFGGYVGGREWYFAVDWGVAFVGGAVMGSAEAASLDGDPCAAALWGTWCAVVLGVVQVGALVVLRPNSVRLEFWCSLVLGALGVVSVVLTLSGEDDGSAVVGTIMAILEPTLAVMLMLGRLELFGGDYHSFQPSSHETEPLQSLRGTEHQKRSPLGPAKQSVHDDLHHASTGFAMSASLQQLRLLIEAICERQLLENDKSN